MAGVLEVEVICDEETGAVMVNYRQGGTEDINKLELNLINQSKAHCEYLFQQLSHGTYQIVDAKIIQ
ncbi:hypothetical protein [Leminorella grimontii]|uniref:hypothetical protein n=1 Tax=Leminorella grimontii TaxID=82981 RepID=UPI00321F6A28